MANSLATRAARACAAATLVFSLGLAPSFARMGGAGGGPSARPAFGFGHPHSAAHGFNRFDGGRSGFHRFGPNRFDRFGFNNRFNRFGFNRFNRFAGNQLFIGGVGCCGWGGWGAVPIPAASSEPVGVGGGPVIINISADPGPAAGGGGSGGCVTHTLTYDSDGKYAGERGSSQC
jgi:hypothetical protein